MLLWFMFSLTVVLGQETDYDCESGQPSCLYIKPFSDESVRAYQESGNFLPSNEFFQENCDDMIETVNCVREYHKTCQDPHIIVDSEAVVNNVIEFCDENSALRKAFVAHVDCFNHMNFTNQPCYISTRNTMRNLDSHGREVMSTRGIARICLHLYLLTHCAVDSASDSCGEEVGQAAADVIDRISNIYYCNKDDEDFFEELLEDLDARINELD